MDLGRYDWRVIMVTATVAMLIQQSFAYVCQIVMPILADRIAEDFGISRAWLGLYLSLTSGMAILAAMGCGGFILRYGPLRISQITLLLMGSSLVLVGAGILWVYPIAAMLLGAAAVSTPASSHILARVVPPRLAPLVFSVKQTGVPVGALIGGLLVPLLLGVAVYSATFGVTIRLGTYGAALATGLIVYSVALMLQPVRAYFDSERDPDTKISFGDLRTTMRAVVGNPPLRDLAFAAFSFGGLQALFSGFFIIFLIDGLGYSEIEAGGAFAIASVSAVAARVLWGWLGGGVVAPRSILAGIGLVSTGSAVATALYGPGWTLTQITVVAIVFNMSALSWHGILLAEIARLAPRGQVGGTTGGVLAFVSLAMMTYPAIYGGILAATGSYAVGYLLGATPAALAFLVFLGPPREESLARLAARQATGFLTPLRAVRILMILAIGVAIGLVIGSFGQSL